MFSGKTTALLQRLRSSNVTSVLAVKPAIERRYSETQIVSHGGLAYPAAPISAPFEMLQLAGDHTEVVGVDEAHFFDEGLIEVADTLRRRGIHVLFTALDLSSWGRSFPVIDSIRRMSDEVAVLHAVCAQCGRRADHTQRLTPIVGASLVGGPESYEPRCPSCWRPPAEPQPS